MKSKKLLIILAAVLCLNFTACSGKGSESSSAADSSSSQSESSEADDKGSSSKAESSSSQVKQGKRIKAAYKKLSNKNYSFKEKITDQNGDVTDVVYTAEGDNFASVNKNKYGESGIVKIDDAVYEYDEVCGVYRILSVSSISKTSNFIKAVVENNLPQTNTRINSKDKKKYDVEEYTYAGSTYITVLDFCFDKKSGDIVKYYVTYIVEGKDNAQQTREITDISDKSDSDLISDKKVKELKNFDEMTEAEKTTLWNDLSDKYNITDEKKTAENMTDEKIKTMGYEEFTAGVYRCLKK